MSKIPMYNHLKIIYSIFCIWLFLFLFDYFVYAKWKVHNDTSFLLNELRKKGKMFRRSLPKYRDRGIVIPTLQKNIVNTMVLIRILKSYSVQLPITVCVTNSDTEEILTSHLSNQCEIMNISEYTSLDETEMEGEQLNIMTLIYTKYNEVLLMHPNIILLNNPEVLFETEEYKSSGTFFWRREIPKGFFDKSRYQWINKIIPYEIETNPVLLKKSKSCLCGKIVCMNKNLHKKSLHKLYLLNKYWDIVYTYLDYGDTLWMGCEFAREDYQLTSYNPGIIGNRTSLNLKGDRIYYLNYPSHHNIFIDKPIENDTEYNDITFVHDHSISNKHATKIDKDIEHKLNEYKKEYHKVMEFYVN